MRATRPEPGQSSRRGRGAAFAIAALVSAVVLIAAFYWGLSLGARHVQPAAILGALFSYDGSSNELVVRSLRLPRTLLAVLVGASMALAGVIMQGVTRNPLGAPEILGVSAGAAVAVVVVAAFFPAFGGVWLLAAAFGGAAAAAVIVLALAGAGRGRTDPVRLALAGVTVTLLLLSVSQGLIIFHENTAQSVFFWLVGGVNFGQWHEVALLAPWALAGTILALALAQSLNVLALGDDVARGLGQNVDRTRAMGALSVIILAGAAAAVAGPVSFIGLIVPHIARRLVGVNHFLVMPLALLLGAALLVLADDLTHFVRPPYEVPAGILTALVGAPFFIYLARRTRLA